MGPFKAPVFTDRTRRVMERARDEAARLGHPYLGTEHLLLGLLAEKGGVSTEILRRLEVDPGAVRRRILASLRPGNESAAPVPGELPFTSRSKKVLEFSIAEARRLHHRHVGTEHLLLGLLREKPGIAAQVLTALGATLEEARRLTVELFSPGGRGADDLPRDFDVRIDDESSTSIYGQIVEQLREAVATGRLAPGQRLWPVRRLADQLDIAPGTVARAYRELERLGVVETDGARGTRVAEVPGREPPPEERGETLEGLLRPVAVAAFHLGATAAELRDALDRAMRGILGEGHAG